MPIAANIESLCTFFGPRRAFGLRLFLGGWGYAGLAALSRALGALFGGLFRLLVEALQSWQQCPEQHVCMYGAMAVTLHLHMHGCC